MCFLDVPEALPSQLRRCLAGWPPQLKETPAFYTGVLQGPALIFRERINLLADHAAHALWRFQFNL